jgi:hypothetical protein
MTDLTALLTSARMVRLGQARAWLFALWGVGALIIGFRFAYFSGNGYFGENAGHASQAWAWLGPMLLPIVAIITASFVVNAVEGDARDQVTIARPIVYYATLLLAIVYLGSLFFSVENAVLGGIGETTRWNERLAIAAIPLTLLQGIVAGLIGVFFTAERGQSRSG